MKLVSQIIALVLPGLTSNQVVAVIGIGLLLLRTVINTDTTNRKKGKMRHKSRDLESKIWNINRRRLHH